MKLDSSGRRRAPLTAACWWVVATTSACGAPNTTPRDATPTSTATRVDPVAAPDPFARARRRIAHHETHTCAIQPDGALYCWGDNGAGQIGVTEPARALSAVRVAGLPPVVSVAVDALSTCAVGADGSLWCFGFTYGPGSASGPLHTPTRVPGFEGVVAVALGVSHRCALFASGKVACFGDGIERLGGRTDDTPERAAVVAGLPPATSLVASNGTTCTLGRDGQAWCFGPAVCGKPAGEKEETSAAPYPVPDMGGLARLSLADDALCGLDAAGAARCVRCADRWSRAPGERVSVPSTTGATTLSADASRGCVVIDGRVACWGALARGWSFGRRPIVIDPSPKLEDRLGLSHVADVAVTPTSACALGEDGGVKCWGENRRGELGAGSEPWATTLGGPERALGLDPITTIAASGNVTCVANGSEARCFGAPAQLDAAAAGQRLGPAAMVWSTGWDICGNAGQNEPSCFATNARSTGPDVQGATWQTTGYASGPEGKCVVIDGKPRCAAREDRSALLDEISRLVGVQSIAFGQSHACVATVSGSVLCAGENEHGQLGRRGKGSTRLAPVAGISKAISVVAGDTQTCALTNALDVYCWGIDARVGERKGTDGVRPRKMVTQARDLVAGRRHFCASDYTWKLWCWGSDEMGQLGDSAARAYAFDPIVVPTGENSQVMDVEAGAEHTCALTNDSVVQCWGNNSDGQLGDAVARGFYERPFFVSGLPQTPKPTPTKRKPGGPIDLDG